MTNVTRRDEIARDLIAVEGKLSDINAALAAAPIHKRGSRWWTDRIWARQSLTKVRDALHAERTSLGDN